MEHIISYSQLNKGDTIIAVESANGNVNTFQGVVTDVNRGDVTLNEEFSFSWSSDGDQYVILLAPVGTYRGKHRE